MVNKLHQFAKWQQSKFAEEAGLASEVLSKQLQTMMNKSIKIILKHYEVVLSKDEQEYFGIPNTSSVLDTEQLN